MLLEYHRPPGITIESFPNRVIDLDEWAEKICESELCTDREFLVETVEENITKKHSEKLTSLIDAVSEVVAICIYSDMTSETLQTFGWCIEIMETEKDIKLPKPEDIFLPISSKIEGVPPYKKQYKHVMEVYQNIVDQGLF